MRYPVAETAEKHARILCAASALFCEHGFAGVSVGKIMQATGALAAEIAREQDVGSALTQHLAAAIDRLQRLFPWRVKKNARGESIRMLSTMVAALTLSRAVDDPKLSEASSTAAMLVRCVAVSPSC